MAYHRYFDVDTHLVRVLQHLLARASRPAMAA